MTDIRIMGGVRDWAAWGRTTLAVSVVAVLLCLGAINVAVRATWDELEDGVLWVQQPHGVVAAEVAPGAAGARAGVRRGDVLVAIDGRPVETVSDVLEALHGAQEAGWLRYAVVRLNQRQALDLALTPVPQGHRALYFLLAGVAFFTLLVGASVRVRRPGDQASLHFFWLCVAFYGVFAFSFSGRLDRLDWIFYWADVVAHLVLPPLFLHFALVFPERHSGWLRTPAGSSLVAALYVPALVMGGLRVSVLSRSSIEGVALSQWLDALDRLELGYLALCVMAGLGLMIHALRRVRSVTARRQLRWIVLGTVLGGVPFTLGYLVPFVLGVTPPAWMAVTALGLGIVPLTFASAIVRYRLLDVEVIIKRGLVYAAAVASIVVIYAVLLRVAGLLFLDGSQQHNSVIAVLATLVVVLLAQPVKDAIQAALDRVYYRDRYDYRRALVVFARELNSDLDIHRLSERLVSRVRETLLVERMALMVAPLDEEHADEFRAIRSIGFPDDVVPPLSRRTGVGARVLGGRTVVLDDPVQTRRLPVDEMTFWRGHGLHHFVPCVSKEGTIAALALGRRPDGEPLNSEDVALLTAVAAQIATAVENARLYRQLRVKADELDRLRRFSDNVIESLNDGLVVVDLDDRVLRWNQTLARLYGVSNESAVACRLGELFDAEFFDALQRARRDRPDEAVLFRVPLLSRHAEGRRRLLVNAAVAPLRTPGGATAGAILILEDVTSRAQLEEQLQISEKMASIGLLAAGVAHEVNTPLAGISSFTQMLLQDSDPEDPRTRMLEKIETQTFRAARIVNGLLNLARPPQVEMGPVDLHVVINDVLSLLEHQFKTARVSVRKELAPVPALVVGIEHKLQQVFLNLFLNARDAMPKGGWLSIATALEAGTVRVEVADTGSGIPSDHLSRIYDPFFTTKTMGQGTGLGLSITYGIVQEHGGTISCDSVVGQGARFVLALPLDDTARRHGELAT